MSVTGLGTMMSERLRPEHGGREPGLRDDAKWRCEQLAHAPVGCQLKLLVQGGDLT